MSWEANWKSEKGTATWRRKSHCGCAPETRAKLAGENSPTFSDTSERFHVGDPTGQHARPSHFSEVAHWKGALFRAATHRAIQKLSCDEWAPRFEPLLLESISQTPSVQAQTRTPGGLLGSSARSEECPSRLNSQECCPKSQQVRTGHAQQPGTDAYASNKIAQAQRLQMKWQQSFVPQWHKKWGMLHAVLASKWHTPASEHSGPCDLPPGKLWKSLWTIRSLHPDWEPIDGRCWSRPGVPPCCSKLNCGRWKESSWLLPLLHAWGCEWLGYAEPIKQGKGLNISSQWLSAAICALQNWTWPAFFW